MTREEAVEQLEWYFEEDNGISADLVTKQAFDTIKKALSQEPCDRCVYSTKDGYCQYDDITETIPPLEPCNNAVSREAVEEMIKAEMPERGMWEIGGNAGDIEKQTVCEVCVDLLQSLNELPSVTQKSGKWIEHPEIETSTPEYLMFYECSECGNKQCFCKSDIHKKRFCSNCGAKMESEDEE